MYVCTSVPKAAYANYKESLIAYKTDKRAAFFAYLAYAKAVSDGDEEKRLQILHDIAEYSLVKEVDTYNKGGMLESVFEEEVYQLLAQRVDESYLHLQETCGGFRIDMVYHKPGCQKIAIECDGAKYHSSRQAYLYDRTRQSILEKEGYVFHRIWSTLFWRKPLKEINKLIDFIDTFGNTPIKARDSELNNSNAFLTVSPSVGSNLPRTSEPPNAVTLKNQNHTEKLGVQIGSIVTLNYPQKGRSQRIILTDNKSLAREGYVTVESKSEVGANLIGRQVNDSILLKNGLEVVVISIES